MEEKKYILRSLSDIIKVGATLKKNWFRGHSKTWNSLQPNLYRIPDNSLESLLQQSIPGKEIESANYFRRRSLPILKDVPEDKDYITWLMHMQHFGFPTRLLDWSENILIAAFFSVVHDQLEDGELWIMYPIELNKKSDLEGICNHRSLHVKNLSIFPFEGTSVSLDSDLSDFVNAPIAFIPQYLFPRLIAQSSTFTIHKGSVEGKTETIQQALEGSSNLVRYIIP